MDETGSVNNTHQRKVLFSPKDLVLGFQHLLAMYSGYTVCAVEQAEGSVMLDNLQLDKTKK